MYIVLLQVFHSWQGMIIISVADFLMFNFSIDPGADPRHIDSKTCFKKFQQNYTSFFLSLTKLRVFMFQSVLAFLNFVQTNRVIWIRINNPAKFG